MYMMFQEVKTERQDWTRLYDAINPQAKALILHIVRRGTTELCTPEHLYHLGKIGYFLKLKSGYWLQERWHLIFNIYKVVVIC